MSRDKPGLPRERDIKARDEHVRSAYADYEGGKLTRREFLQYASLMGASLAALGLAGCMATPTPAPPPTALSAVRPNALPMAVTATSVPHSSGGIRRGGTLNTNFVMPLGRINDPAIAAYASVSNIVRLACDWLVRVGPDLAVRPALATEWTPSADGNDWIFTLRKGVRFNHGKAFNADDVLFTIGRLLNPKLSSSSSSPVFYRQPTSIEKVDDFTVVFHADKPIADLPHYLHDYRAAVLPADWTGDFYKAPWGTGPFVITDFQPDQSLTAKRRDNYWEIGVDGKALPYVDQIQVRSYPDDVASLRALSKGESDLVGVAPPAIPEVMQMGNAQLVVWQLGGYINAVMRCDTKPFDNPLMRQALKLAVDRQQFVDNFLQGHAIPAYDSPLMDFCKDWPAPKPFKPDVERAKKLMAQAGYANGVDITVTTDALHSTVASWLAESAKAAGFQVTQTVNSAYYQSWLKDWGDNVMGANDWAMRATPGEILSVAYTSNGAGNENRWKNTRFDQLFDAYMVELDAAKRKAELAQLCDLIASDGGNLICAHPQHFYAQAKRLNGFRPNPIGAMYYQEAWLSQ